MGKLRISLNLPLFSTKAQSMSSKPSEPVSLNSEQDLQSSYIHASVEDPYRSLIIFS